MTARASQTTLEALDAGSGVAHARTSQSALEVVRNDLTPLVHASQATLEVLHNDQVLHIRTTQAVLEVLHDLGSASGYVCIVASAR